MIRQWLLGPHWSLKNEVKAELDITARLRADSAGRMAISAAIAVLSCWIMPAWLAIGWGVLIWLDEALERSWPYRTFEERGIQLTGVVAMLAHRLVGGSVWAAMGVAWMLQGGFHQLLGLAILTGILIHVSQLYNNSRLQTVATALPAFAGFFIVLGGVYSDPVMSLYEKVTVAFAIHAILIYLIVSSMHNLRIREQLEELLRQSDRLAAEDSLTGLSNRRRFEELVHEQTEADACATVAFIDLDRFKPLNDEYGHAVGDEVLREIGQRLRGQPNMLAAARVGGDEFAVLIGCSVNEQMIERQIETLHSQLTAPIRSGAGNVAVGASIGWARVSGPGTAVSEVLHAADVAMRRAKFERLDVVKYDPVIDSAAMASSAMEIAFRHALTSGQIRAALQPIVSVADGRTVAMELLARWPDSGLLRDPSPQDFIPIAERVGLLNELLWCTLEQALPEISSTGQTLAVNVSPSQLTSTNFLFNLTVMITKHGVAPNRIELEVTEQVAFRNVTENCAVLEKARAVGYRVVLDDFGSGYSSLAMLDKLPLDKIKLDRAFAGDLLTCAARQKIMRATIALAHELGICCSVEGIECAATASMVASFGCDQMQGFWVGRPVTLEQSPVLLELAG